MYFRYRLKSCDLNTDILLTVDAVTGNVLSLDLTLETQKLCGSLNKLSLHAGNSKYPVYKTTKYKLHNLFVSGTY